MTSNTGGERPFLVADVGNTRIGVGIAEDGKVRNVSRVASHDDSEWAAVLRGTRDASAAEPRILVIGSVAPEVGNRFAARAREIISVTTHFVRDDIPMPLALDVDNENEVGVDRVCSAAAAYDRIRAACAIASLGTAITIDFVSSAGQFMGGTILPGLQMACDALHERTAALPRVEVHAAESALGRNTRDAINNGVVYGAVGAIREIVERFAERAGAWPQLVATGGNAELIRAHADFVDVVVPDLCLLGVALAFRKAGRSG